MAAALSWTVTPIWF